MARGLGKKPTEQDKRSKDFVNFQEIMQDPAFPMDLYGYAVEVPLKESGGSYMASVYAGPEGTDVLILGYEKGDSYYFLTSSKGDLKQVAYLHANEKPKDLPRDRMMTNFQNLLGYWAIRAENYNSLAQDAAAVKTSSR